MLTLGNNFKAGVYFLSLKYKPGPLLSLSLSHTHRHTCFCCCKSAPRIKGLEVVYNAIESPSLSYKGTILDYEENSRLPW